MSMGKRLLAILLLLCLPWTAGAEAAPFWAEFVAVGAGDCILVGCDGATMMVDTGPQKAWDAVQAALDEHGIDRLDMLVVTHPHPDHAGNVARVLESCTVATLLVSSSADEATRTGAPKAVAASGAAVVPVTRGQTYQLGRAVLQILWPDALPQNLVNDTSIVMKVSYEGFSMLLTGDAERAAEMQMLVGDNALPLAADLLKTGHHGLNTSTTYPFARAVGAKYAVASCAAPSYKVTMAQITLDTLIRCGAKTVLETGVVGNISLTIDEQGRLVITTEK